MICDGLIYLISPFTCAVSQSLSDAFEMQKCDVIILTERVIMFFGSYAYILSSVA